MPLDPNTPRGVLTLVCLTCGNRKYYDDTPPNRVKCEQCGNTVFRNSPRRPSPMRRRSNSSRRHGARSRSANSPETTPDDISELNNL